MISIHSHNLCFMCWGFEISDWEMFDTTPVQWRWMTFHYFCSRPSPEEQRTHCQDWKSCDVLWPRKAFPHTQPLQNTQLYNSEEITLYNLQFKPLVPKKKKKAWKAVSTYYFLAFHVCTGSWPAQPGEASALRVLQYTACAQWAVNVTILEHSIRLSSYIHAQ